MSQKGVLSAGEAETSDHRDYSAQTGSKEPACFISSVRLPGLQTGQTDHIRSYL